MRSLGWVLACGCLLSACHGRGTLGVDGSVADGGSVVEGGAHGDGGSSGDAGDGGGLTDATFEDGASAWDAGVRDGAVGDAAVRDASARDAAVGDAAVRDASARDAAVGDAAVRDASVRDAGVRDAGVRDAGGSGGCISGAAGTHAVRFRWNGSGPRSTAYVGYELNQLPDTSRWHVSAASMSIGYRPVFDDTYLGIGGLDLEGTTFIDVELSTSGLSSIRNVTIAIFGRSFATTSSGSFRWQTFDGIGASPSGSVANSAPYEWYRADATAQFTPGDSGVLLRLRAGPPSNALIVNRVEVCFDAS